MKIGKRLTIDLKSFTRKAPKKVIEDFGVSLINGYMGTGKTYVAVYFLQKYFKDLKIKTNIKSLNISGVDSNNIIYVDTISEIVKDFEPHCIYVLDELGKKYPKECKMDKDFYNWLQHSRKCKRYVFLIHQEYLQVPIWLRGICSTVYTTTKMPLIPIFKTYKGYPYLTEDKEWDIQIISTHIYKRNQRICDMYDTFETVSLF